MGRDVVPDGLGGKKGKSNVTVEQRVTSRKYVHFSHPKKRSFFKVFDMVKTTENYFNQQQTKNCQRREV